MISNGAYTVDVLEMRNQNFCLNRVFLDVHGIDIVQDALVSSLRTRFRVISVKRVVVLAFIVGAKTTF